MKQKTKIIKCNNCGHLYTGSVDPIFGELEYLEEVNVYLQNKNLELIRANEELKKENLIFMIGLCVGLILFFAASVTWAF